MTSTTSPGRPARTPAAVPVPVLWAARVLLGLLGVALLAGAAYFTFFAAPEDGGVAGPIDWVVAVWAMVTAVGLLVAAVQLGNGTRRTLGIARAFLVSHLVFGLVKVVFYAEPESASFIVVDLLLLGLLAIRRRGR